VDESLVADVTLAREGDRDAFSRVVAAFRDTAVATAYGWLGDREAALDATQEAFADAYRLLGRLVQPAAFPGWLRRIIIKHCDRITRRRALLTTPLVEAPAVVDSRDPSEDVGDALRAESLRRAVDALDPSERIVVALHYVADMSQPSIASYLELPLTTVEHRVRAARRKLREVLTMNEPLAELRPSQRFDDDIRLFLAIRASDADGVRHLISQRPELVEAEEDWDPDYARRGILPHPQHGTPLVRAVERGDRSVVEALLDGGASPNGACGCATAERPLWTAATFGRADLVRLLLDRGASPDAPIGSGVTPLHVAAMRGATDVVEVLLAGGADADALDASGRTAAQWAELKGFTAIKDRLTDGGATPSETHLETGIKALELFCPLPRGGIIRQEPGNGLGHAVLLLELTSRLSGRPRTTVAWCGFEQRPYDRADLAAELREGGLEGRIPLLVAPSSEGDAACRETFANTIEHSRHRAQQTGEDVVLVVFAEAGLASAIEAALPAFGVHGAGSLSAIVAGPLREIPGEPEPLKAPYDGRIVFDAHRAQHRMWPAVGPASALRCGEHATTLAARAALEAPDAFDAGPGCALHAYLCQPFEVGEPFTAAPSTWVSRREVLSDVAELLRSG
jgi:RNA polymerase sigma factor (sigma-70 family)